MNWEDTKILLAIGRTGGLSRSAKLLGISVSTVHRRAVELERSLNATLFSRDSDGYTLTQVGERYFSLAEKAEEHLTAMERYNDQGQQSLFRVALPELIGQQLLQSKLAALQLEYSDLQLELSTSVVPVEFSRREADIILRLVRPESGRYIVRRLGQLKYGLYCSKDYLANLTKHTEVIDLQNLRIIGWDRNLQYTFLAQWIQELTQGAAPILSFDNMHSQLLAAMEGLGVVALPCFVAENSGLVPILPKRTLQQDVWLMRHLDTKNCNYSTMISEMIEKELREHLL
ncbi:LysR family transcriptional regulator [Vibrio sp. E150_011]